MTDWAMFGEHFKPIGKRVYLYFPKGVMMVHGAEVLTLLLQFKYNIAY
jgi:hypothetical protein